MQKSQPSIRLNYLVNFASPWPGEETVDNGHYDKDRKEKAGMSRPGPITSCGVACSGALLKLRPSHEILVDFASRSV